MPWKVGRSGEIEHPYHAFNLRRKNEHLTRFRRSKSQLMDLYFAVALLTFLFQLWVRSYQCSGFQECGLSFAKAFAWSVIWPVSWAVYAAGLL